MTGDHYRFFSKTQTTSTFFSEEGGGKKKKKKKKGEKKVKWHHLAVQHIIELEW